MMNKKIIDRLETTLEGDGVENEIWVDPITKIQYDVPIEIVRDFDNAEIVGNPTDLYITEEKFLHWYFSCGTDDEIQETVRDLGQRAIVNLMSERSFHISISTIFQEADHGSIPVKLLEEFMQDSHETLSEMKGPWVLRLISDNK